MSWTNDVLETLGDHIPLETCLREAAAAGYAGVELGRKFPREEKALRAALSPHGLELASGWYSGYLIDRSVEEELAAADSHIALLKHMGCEVMVYGECGLMQGEQPWERPLTETVVLEEKELAEYAHRLGRFAHALKRRGLQLGYHHHLKMLIETESEIDWLMAHTPSEVGLLLDTGHLTAAGGSVARVLQKHGKRVVHVHLKDVRQDVWARCRGAKVSFNEGVRCGMFTVPGDGDVLFAPLQGFFASGWRGWAVVEAEQDPQKADPAAYVKKGMDTVRILLPAGMP